MSSVSMQKIDLEALHWSSSTDRQNTSPRQFLAFLDIFSHLTLTILHENYWKWLWRLSTWWSTSIQFVDLGYCFQGHLRPAKMTQKWYLRLWSHIPLLLAVTALTRKKIIPSLLKFAGYIHNHKILPGNIFGLILKNKMAARDVYST